MEQRHATTMVFSLHRRGLQMECHRGNFGEKGRIVERRSFAMAGGTREENGKESGERECRGYFDGYGFEGWDSFFVFERFMRPLDGALVVHSVCLS